MLLPINTVSIIFSARHNENILRCIRLSNMEIIPIKKCSKVRAFEGILMLFLSRVHVAIYVRILSFLPSFIQSANSHEHLLYSRQIGEGSKDKGKLLDHEVFILN